MMPAKNTNFGVFEKEGEIFAPFCYSSKVFFRLFFSSLGKHPQACSLFTVASVKDVSVFLKPVHLRTFFFIPFFLPSLVTPKNKKKKKKCKRRDE